MDGTTMNSSPKVGESVKVSLPGETPWAECMAILPDGSFVGRIDNELVGSASEEKRLELARHWFPDAKEPIPKKHDFKFNDLVRFSWRPFKDWPEYSGWQPSEWKAS